MNDLHAIVLGIVQGITEWLPISSTAHLQVVPTLLGWPNPPTHFKAAIQLGTVLAALIYFRKDILDVLTRAPQSGAIEGRADRRLLVPVIVGTIPVVVVGLAFHRIIENTIQNLWVEAVSMIVFGLILAYAERRTRVNRQMDTVTISDGLTVGLGQMLALIPGASRSGTTMTAAMFTGLERGTAARFSFLLSIPAVTGAGLYEAIKARHEIVASHMMRPLLLATLASFLIGWASIAWLLGYLKTRPTYVFVVYRLIVGALLLALLWGGHLSAT
jgi:undecaprenyl-diphosphatase